MTAERFAGEVGVQMLAAVTQPFGLPASAGIFGLVDRTILLDEQWGGRAAMAVLNGLQTLLGGFPRAGRLGGHFLSLVRGPVDYRVLEHACSCSRYGIQTERDAVSTTRPVAVPSLGPHFGFWRESLRLGFRLMCEAHRARRYESTRRKRSWLVVRCTCMPKH